MVQLALKGFRTQKYRHGGRMRTKTLVLLWAVLLTLAATGQAQTPAVTSFTGGVSFLGIDGTARTVGWTFTANNYLIVSALGFWDSNTSDDLLASHQLGLWTAAGSLVTSVSVQANDPATGNWRYHALAAPVLLAPGQYVIGATVTNPASDDYVRVPVSGGTVTTLASIAVGMSAISPSASGFAFPDTTEVGNLARFGPNLEVAPPSPPSITKTFGAAAIPLNGGTSLTLTISNPNSLGLSGLSFTDNLPAGLVVASSPNLSNTCNGTPTATAGAASVSLSLGTVAASGSCTVSLNVTATTAGVKNNSVQINSTEGGVGNTSTASLTVVAPPVIIKSFGAASVALNGSTSLSFTIQNNNASTALNGVGFSDSLPSGLVVSTPNGLTGSCGGGTITATQATGVVSLSGATLAASTSCTFSVNVTGTTTGTKTNTTAAVTSTEGGTGGTASASLKVEGPPSISAVFNPNAVGPNSASSLQFTIANPSSNPDALAGVAFSLTLPAGLTVPSASSTVCGGTLATTAPSTIALSGATVAANSQCQFNLNVGVGPTTGTFTATTSNVSSTNGGTGNTASASLSVSVQSVPISPGTLLLIGAGLAFVAWLQMRRTGPAPISILTAS
jgi:hypothetical protein